MPLVTVLFLGKPSSVLPFFLSLSELVTPSQDACQNPVTEVLGTPIPILRASAAAILVSLILQL